MNKYMKTNNEEMTLKDFMNILHKDVDVFEEGMKEWQKTSEDKGGIPEKMEYGEWFDQFITFYTGKI